jgi:hypothetical protein
LFKLSASGALKVMTACASPVYATVELVELLTVVE